MLQKDQEPALGVEQEGSAIPGTGMLERNIQAITTVNRSLAHRLCFPTDLDHINRDNAEQITYRIHRNTYPLAADEGATAMDMDGGTPTGSRIGDWLVVETQEFQVAKRLLFAVPTSTGFERFTRELPGHIPVALLGDRSRPQVIDSAVTGVIKSRAGQVVGGADCEVAINANQVVAKPI